MSRKCQVSRKRYNRSNKLCFSNKKHRHPQHPNTQVKRLWVPELNRMVSLRVSTKVLKTITTYGFMSALKRYGRELQEFV
ncbi:MAG: mitochondrial large ribosomal subunit protein bL28m [Cyanobacteria bacterium HKST-UBA06]|nr:mitochondrial large ribosomal subunit protein bL28m [Cyanobacteria bacterium HKST-UBA06]